VAGKAVAGQGQHGKRPILPQPEGELRRRPNLLVVAKRVGYSRRSLAPLCGIPYCEAAVTHADMLGDLFGVPAPGIRIINLQLTGRAL
jgi:hypothetical protein